MQTFTIDRHEPSFLPDGKSFRLAWADEFDGTALNRDNWDFRLSMMGKEWPSWTGEDGVSLDGNSNVVFTLLNKDGRLVCSQMQTGYNFMDAPVTTTRFCNEPLQWTIGKLRLSKYLHGPGYFECRCRLQQKPGWWSAFWIQSPVIGASLDPADTGVEIDVMESFKPGNVVAHNVFTGGYGQDCKRAKVGGGLNLNKEEFHRFGLLWDDTGYTFYVDGVEDGHIDAFKTTRPEFILISTEVIGYRKDGHEPYPEAYEAVGDTFVVDYVRVFDAQ